ncbi:MAG: AAA family ATPase [Firmicutes bacterium]|nr:AAA family ATPase [Bacillota bacterium]
MKLVSCSVANFGILENFHYDFAGGLNELKRDNGSGKSTLAAFVISMLYGISAKGKNVANNDRVHYKPFQGGLFGGSLVFEYAGKTYKVDRDFDKKNDEFVLTNVTDQTVATEIDGVAVDFSNLGDVLFGISKDSYKRSAFVPQDEIISSTVDGGLGEKLRDIVLNTSENNNFAGAIATLDGLIEGIDKSKTEGKVAEILQAIKEQKAVIDASKVANKNATKLRKELAGLDKDLSKCDAAIRSLDLQIIEDSKNQALLEQKAMYQQIVADIEDKKAQIAIVIPFFKGQVIEKISLEKTKKQVDGLAKQNETVRGLQNDIEREQLNIKSFNERKAYDTKSKAEQKQSLQKQIEDIETNKPKLKEQIEEQTTALKKRSSGAAAGVILLLLGLVPGIIFFAARGGKTKKMKAQLQESQKSLDESDQKIASIDKEIERIDTEIANIASNQYQSESDMADMQAKLAKALEKQEQANEQIKDFFDGFECDKKLINKKQFVDAFYEIDKKLTEYQYNTKDVVVSEQRLKEFAKGKDLDALLAVKPTAIPLEELHANREGKQNERQLVVDQMNALRMEVVDANEAAANLPEQDKALQDLEASKTKLLAQKELLVQAKAVMMQANDSLSQKYLVPLSKETAELAKIMGVDKGVGIDSEGNLLVDEKGKERKLDYFSKGIRELVSISMRLRLVDLIFEKNDIKKPCVILDDPFVNLDGKKLDEARKYIREISKKYQILYLTCHDSRLIVGI